MFMTEEAFFMEQKQNLTRWFAMKFAKFLLLACQYTNVQICIISKLFSF